MKKAGIYLVPTAGSLLLIMLYLLSICFRGLLSPQEYEFALQLRELCPRVSGAILPKLPAAAATLFTALFLWLAAMRLKLLHPGAAPCMYLTFPIVWWVGTSASPVPVMALLITVAAAGLFVSRREERLAGKLIGFAGGVAGATGAACFAKSGFFSWDALAMALLPILCLILAVRLEKLDDRGMAAPLLDRFGIFMAMLLLTMLAVLVLPPLCRQFKVSYPAYLTLFRPGESLYRSALAVFVPLLWLFLARKGEKSEEKIFLLCFASGFLLLALPPSLPWARLSSTLSPETLGPLKKELFSDRPATCFADDSSAAALKYCLDIPVIRVGRGPNDLPPSLLRNEMIECLASEDVIVASHRGELDAFLPKGRKKMIFTSPHNLQLILFRKGE